VISLALVTVTMTMLFVGGTCALATRLILSRTGVSSSAAAGWGAVLGPVGIAVACMIAAHRDGRVGAGVQKAVTRVRGSVRRQGPQQDQSTTIDPFA
jgi:hypothetical protein